MSRILTALVFFYCSTAYAQSCKVKVDEFTGERRFQARITSGMYDVVMISNSVADTILLYTNTTGNKVGFLVDYTRPATLLLGNGKSFSLAMSREGTEPLITDPNRSIWLGAKLDHETLDQILQFGIKAIRYPIDGRFQDAQLTENAITKTKKLAACVLNK